MAIDKEVVKYVAHLARIELKSEELDKLSKQLQDILDFIDQLKEVDIENINPTSHALSINNVFREDTLKESLPQDKSLMNAPSKKEGSFTVPRVIE